MKDMFERIRHMLWKELIVLLRDPKMRPVIFVTPVVQLFLFGYAVNTDVKHVDVAVFDLDNSIASREIVTRFVRSGYFDVTRYLKDEADVENLLNRGDVTAVLRMNHGFGADQEAGRTSDLQVILDGTDSNATRIIADYALRITAAYNMEHLKARYVRLIGNAPMNEAVALESRAWFNENLESRNYLVPGVIASLTLILTLTLTSMAIVREREVGTMEQMIATPIRQVEFILGKTLPFALIGYLNVIMITVVGVFWFEVPFRGSLVVLFLGISLYLMSTLGYGLLISTVSKTQQQAMMATFFFAVPFMLLSGFIFPIANMPKPVQWLTYVDPIRYILVIIRGVFLKGAGFDILWPQFVALFILGIVTLTLATRRFHKTLS